MAGVLKFAGAAALLVLAAACSGNPSPTQTPTATPAGTPGATTTVPPTGTVTLPPGAGNECASLPTFDPSNPLPSFASDPALEAHFPAEIDGEQVRDLTSFSWAQIACIGGQAAVDAVRGTA